MKKDLLIGNKIINSNKGITIQSMTTTKTSDVKSTIDQIISLENVGCDIIRVAINTEEDCLAIKNIKKDIHIPIVADIQFDYRMAIKAIECGVDKIRINPGNIGSEDKIAEVAKCLIDYDIPVRVGSNSGSVEKELLSKYGNNEISLGESVLSNVYLLEKYGVSKIVLSCKSSNVSLMSKAYRYLYNKLPEYYYHLGVTEAGCGYDGIIKNSIGIGSLLLDGIGDTIRVSLTDKPEEEVKAAKIILKSIGLRNGIDVVACPTCGRTEYDMFSLYYKVKELTKDSEKNLKIAVMGCVVNGPGEAKDANLGIAGGKGSCVLFKNGEVYKTVKSELAEEEFIKELKGII